MCSLFSRCVASYSFWFDGFTEPSVKVLVLLLLRRKHMLHKKFKAYGTKEKALQNRPKEIKDPDDWIYLCDIFSNEKLQARSKTYSENQAKMRCNYRGGSKNFIQHKKEKGNQPEESVGPVQLFHDTLWINEQARELYVSSSSLNYQNKVASFICYVL
ncbi:uncharacterized protein LOC116120612 [Pistacia vera]|uniref:uncharacterized protein LOC116120612 n=1 Tax=Pistacia vera TaxID=55513 RepID=UPI001262FE09|nr:uncharacterized protein LOC116120612 [Pistacia vera]